MLFSSNFLCYLVLPRCFNGLLHLKPTALLLLIEYVSFFLSFSYLLVKYFVLFVLNAKELLHLSINELLSCFLLLLEFLVFLVPSHLSHSISFLSIFINSFLMLSILNLLFELMFNYFLISFAEAIFLFNKLKSLLMFLLLFSFKLIFSLSPD